MAAVAAAEVGAGIFFSLGQGADSCIRPSGHDCGSETSLGDEGDGGLVNGEVVARLAVEQLWSADAPQQVLVVERHPQTTVHTHGHTHGCAHNSAHEDNQRVRRLRGAVMGLTIIGRGGK